MARIEEYTAQNEALHPVETGIEADTQAAYRAGRFYTEGGEALERAAQAKAQGAEGIVRGTEALGKSVGGVAQSVAEAADQAEIFAAHQEISKGAASLAQGSADLTQQWNTQVKGADPNNGAKLQAGFMGDGGEFQQWATNYVDGFATPDAKAWARDQVQHLRTHLFEKTSADVMSMAATAVDTNVTKAARSWSNMAFNDPSSIDWLLQSSEKNINGIIASSPSLSGPDAIKIRDEVLDKAQKAIVHAGIYGAISNASDPEAAVASLAKKYPNLVDGAEEEQFARSAKVQRKMLETYSKSAALYAKQQSDLEVKVTANKIWDDNVSVGPDGSVSINPAFFRAVAKLPGQFQGAPSAIESAKTLLDWGEQQRKPQKALSDPQAVSSLDDRMFDQEEPTTALDILKGEAAGKISRQDGETRLQLIKARDAAGNPDPVMTDALRNARSMIEPYQFQTGVRFGQDKNAAFQLAFMTEYQKQKAAGTLAANALDLNDPKSLISQTLASYRPALAQAVLANGGVGGPRINTGPAAPPRIADKAAYDALDHNTVFIGEDGKQYRKP